MLVYAQFRAKISVLIFIYLLVVWYLLWMEMMSLCLRLSSFFFGLYIIIHIMIHKYRTITHFVKNILPITPSPPLCRYRGELYTERSHAIIPTLFPWSAIPTSQCVV